MQITIACNWMEPLYDMLLSNWVAIFVKLLPDLYGRLDSLHCEEVDKVVWDAFSWLVVGELSDLGFCFHLHMFLFCKL